MSRCKVNRNFMTTIATAPQFRIYRPKIHPSNERRYRSWIMKNILQFISICVEQRIYGRLCPLATPKGFHVGPNINTLVRIHLLISVKNSFRPTASLIPNIKVGTAIKSWFWLERWSAYVVDDLTFRLFTNKFSRIFSSSMLCLSVFLCHPSDCCEVQDKLLWFPNKIFLEVYWQRSPSVADFVWLYMCKLRKVPIVVDIVSLCWCWAFIIFQFPDRDVDVMKIDLKSNLSKSLL